jgi:hypothetical protein
LHWLNSEDIGTEISPSVKMEILILLVCTFFFLKPSSWNAKFKLV